MFSFIKDKSGLSRKEITYSKKMHKFILHSESDLEAKSIVIANSIYMLSCKRLKINPIGIEKAKGIGGGDLIENIISDVERVLHRNIIEEMSTNMLLEYTLEYRNSILENRNSIDDIKERINKLIEETANKLSTC